MAGLFDNVFGGAGGMYGDMLSPEQQAAVRRQSMLQMAAKLLEGSGPSTTRRTIGQTLGSALGAGAEAMQAGQLNAVQQMLMKQKIDEGKNKAGYQKALLAGATGAAQQPAELQSSAPVAGEVGPPAPLPAPAPMSQMDALHSDLIRKAQVANQYGYADDAAKYLEQAFKIKPTEKFSTTPQFGRSPAGTPVSYVLSESGGMKILNVQQNPEFTYQDMGGYISVRDKRDNKEVEQIKKTMSASEAANYQRGSYSVQDTDQGKMYVPTTPGKSAIPVAGPNGAPLRSASADKPTEGQMGASGFANRMEAAEDIFSKIPAAQIPRYGMSGQSSILSYFRSPEGQMAKQAADDWIRSKLRKESGAVIGEEEMEAEYKTYFPMPGDSAQVVAQKAQARQRATDAMKRNAGSAYRPYVPPAPATAPAGLGTGTYNVDKYFN